MPPAEEAPVNSLQMLPGSSVCPGDGNSPIQGLPPVSGKGTVEAGNGGGL